MRAFIAVKLPNGILADIGKLQERLAALRFNFRWVAVGSIHLTLKFLGDIPEDEADPIAAVLADALKSAAPLRLRARGLGVFPNLRQARVIWIGLAGQVPELTVIQKEIDGRLTAIGYPPDKRRFAGHLTLGRSRGYIDPDRLRSAVEEWRGFETEPFTVDRVILFKSDLKPTGAVYTELRRFKLSSPADLAEN